MVKPFVWIIINIDIMCEQDRIVPLELHKL